MGGSRDRLFVVLGNLLAGLVYRPASRDPVLSRPSATPGAGSGTEGRVTTRTEGWKCKVNGRDSTPRERGVAWQRVPRCWPRALGLMALPSR